MKHWMLVWACGVCACGEDTPQMLATDASVDGGLGEAGADADVAQDAAATCIEGQRLTCECAAGGLGFQWCRGGALTACDCGALDGGVRQGDGGPLEYCNPGRFVGDFTCVYEGPDVLFPLEVSGPVAFVLEANERGQDPGCSEFCSDLVIKEGSGELFGVAMVVVAFKGQLQGGLDCTTGEFRAAAVDGEYGLPTSDADGGAEVATLGMFEGSLAGVHSGEATQVVSGDWQLGIPANGGVCAGPFEVTLESP